MAEYVTQVESELAKATGLVRTSGMAMNVWKSRLLEAIDGLLNNEDSRRVDSLWRGLSEDTQGWIILATDMANLGIKEMPGFPGDPELYDMRTIESRTNSVRSRKANLNKKGGTATWRLRELMLEHGLDMSRKALFHKLLEEGFSIGHGTVARVSGDFRQSVALLQEKGLLTREIR